MVNYSSDSLTPVFSALADPTRRAILERLARRESCVTELAEPFDVSLPAISKHLRILENAGLLAREKEGRIYHCRLSVEPLKTAADWIERHRVFWEQQFDALSDYLNESMEKEKRSWQRNPRALRLHSRSEGRLRRRGKKFSKPGRKRKK
jgi:DNA-binding transcriptional ArsR family regulator